MDLQHLSSSSSSKKRKYIDLTNDESSSVGQTNLHSELAKHVEEIAKVKAYALAIERENVDLKLQLKEVNENLKDTRAALGEAIVSANRKKEHVPVPSKISALLSNRAQSPSLEVINASVHSKGKGKGRAQEISTIPHTPANSTERKKYLPYVSVPPRKTPLSIKIEKISPKKSPKLTFISPKKQNSSDSKRRKVQETVETPTSSSTKISGMDVNDDIVSTSSAPSSSIGTAVITKPESKTKSSIKVKDVFYLPPSVTELYLQSAPALEINPPPLELEVPRAFLRLAYGGSDQQFLQYFSADVNPSGPVQRRLVCPMLDMNPAMPFAPGEPGLVFASRHEILSNPPWSLFVKRSPNAPAVWLYLGEYENELCGTMTPEQFQSQKPVVQLEWAKLLLRMKLFDVYVSMRARIALRKAKLIPLGDKVAEERAIKKEIDSVKNNQGHDVTEADIIRAFCDGDEGIDIIRMTCVNYDHVFANDIQAKFTNMDKLVARNKQRKRKEAKSQAGAKRGNVSKRPNASKMKRDERMMTSDGDDADLGDDFFGPVSDVAGQTLRLLPQRSTRGKRSHAYSPSDDEGYMCQD